LAQFASASGDGIAIEASDAGQQGDAASAVLASQKAGQKTTSAFVRSSDEAVESTMLSGHSAFGIPAAGWALARVDAPPSFPPGQMLLLGHRTFTSLRAGCQKANGILFDYCGSYRWTAP
jgi:hypothetical protein